VSISNKIMTDGEDQNDEGIIFNDVKVTSPDSQISSQICMERKNVIKLTLINQNIVMNCKSDHCTNPNSEPPQKHCQTVMAYSNKIIDDYKAKRT